MMQAGVLERNRNVQLVPKVLFGQQIVELRTPRKRAARRANQDPAVLGVYALIDGLRAGQAAIDREKRDHEAARQAARQEVRQEGRTKRIAFVLYYLMAAILMGTLWAAAHG
jgi:hypothetical protein